MINRINSNSNYLLMLNNNLKNKTSITNENFQTKTDKENSKNKITIENLPMNSMGSEAIFKQYGLTSQYSIGENFHLYDISNLTDKFDFELENPKILSFTNEAGCQQFICRMNYPNGGKVVNVDITLPNYTSDVPMDEKTFENNIIKAFKAISKTLSTKNKLGDIQLDSFGISAVYDESTNSLDTKRLQESLLDCINRRTKYVFPENYNGNMNLMVSKIELDKSIKALEEFFSEIFAKK